METNESGETQLINEESASSSTIPKPTTNTDQQDPRKLLAAEINERDTKAAAASALAAASVKAKVCYFVRNILTLNLNIFNFSI